MHLCKRTIVWVFVWALLCGNMVPLQQLCAAEGTYQGDTQETMRAVVTGILSQETRTVPGTNTGSIYQTITARVLGGSEKGKEITIDNDYLALKKGDVFYVTHYVSLTDDRDFYQVSDPYRLTWLSVLAALFLVVIVLFGGTQGIRGLLSLVGGLILIFFVLLPGILHGYSPILMSIAVALVITTVGSYVTHGFNWTTSAAVLGMGSTILLTGVLAWATVHLTKLSGFTSEESVYLNFNTNGSIDLAGLVLGGILIGLLGVLYDAAIGQAVAVDELYLAAPTRTRKATYARAIRIGREHIGALVNTLAIAYVGAALPLLLLFYHSAGENIAVTINRELFATEIVRTLVGSIGVVLTVPITTFIAVLVLHGVSRKEHDSASHGHISL